MTWDDVEVNWKQLKHKIRAEWSALTDDHIDRIGGRREQLSDKIQEFYGVSKDAANAQIDAFADGIKHEDAGS